jgi:MYXO-CTERM domain-containing protein
MTLASRNNAVPIAKFLTVQWFNEHRSLVFVVSLMFGVGLLVQSAVDFTSSRAKADAPYEAALGAGLLALAWQFRRREREGNRGQ